ncbi:glycosyltransferase family 2 protein [Blastococcus sp. BMG 814]|uniref:Glycosyltransferase family 2 protein n=1 Tax=Blastococcus carthaginiensis TaxID=3050034 RepID=A0ABT9IF71_9ACTN|nr:glycosyltransferase family 2 protein [Blastococcus carthaginiensis]MDP5183789.1 glycosyltransferase family 2 protein [Blastococcus carthaginiensis]
MTATGSCADLVSVIVPARDEEESIDATLTSLRRQDYPALQIIVVDGGSTDGTVAVVERHRAEDPRIELLPNPRQIIPAALNIALAAARGRWVVRMDAHSTVGDGYVSAAVARLREGRWGGVGGRKDGFGTTPAGRAIAAALGSRFGVGGSLYHYGTTEQTVDHIPFGAYPTDLLRRLGGWDERLVANEDFEFDYRLRRSGAVLLFDPALKISWKSRQTVRSLYRQYRRYGAGKLDVARLHPASLRPRHLVPPLLVPYLATAAVVAARRPLLGCALLAPYAAGLTAASIGTARTLEDPASRVYVPAAFLAMHVGWGVGVWAQALQLLNESRRP